MDSVLAKAGERHPKVVSVDRAKQGLLGNDLDYVNLLFDAIVSVLKCRFACLVLSVFVVLAS
jgi:hypothetical protein